jgi:hypothetical protein
MLTAFIAALILVAVAATGLAQTPVVEYVDRSSETGLDYTGQPRNASVIDYNNDGYKDLIITFYSYRAQIWESDGQFSLNGAPQFDNYTTSVFDTDDPPASGTTGIIAADYDNDGYIDFIAPNPSTGTVLYRNNNGSTFVDATTTSDLDDIASAPQLAYGHTAAWADYDQDGYLDLTLISGDPESGESTLLLAHNAAGTFDEDASPSVTYAGNSPLWADFDGDDLLDLMILQTAAIPLSTPPPYPYYSYVFINQGDGTFDDEAWDRIGDLGNNFIPGRIAAVADMDNDGDLDVVYAHPDEIGYLENDGDGDFTLEEMVYPTGSIYPTDLAVFDFDLDGYQDVLVGYGDIYDATPTETDVYLYANQAAGGGGREFVNVSSSTGLTDDAYFAGIAVADYNGDGFKDFYLGREDTEEFFYKAKAASGQTQQHWLGVRLSSPHGANATQGLGAKVTVITTTPTIQSLVMDGGGSGLASQHEPCLVFGMGSYSSTVTVYVQWPSGREQTVSGVSVDQTVTVTDESPVIDETTVDFSMVYHVLTGEVDWEFSWETWNDSYGPLDKVVFDLDRTDDDCDPSVGTLTSATTGVSSARRPRAAASTCTN